MNAQPKISLIIPTYNEEKNIKACLTSIFRQKYSLEKLEVIVVDDKSTDRTLEVVREFPVRIIMSGARHGEISKMIGFKKATGELAIYIDADVELIGRNWLRKMSKPLRQDKEIIGSFTRKYSKRTDPALERFMAFDPLQRDSLYKFFSPSINDSKIARREGYSLLEYKEGKIPPAGRCLYRRKTLLKLVSNRNMFLELDFLVILARKGYNKFAYVPSAGLYHHHASSLGELLRKRRYNVKKVYLETYKNKLYKWFDIKKPKDLAKIFFWVIYANLIIPSIVIGIYKSLKHKDFAGMYEPLVNLLVTDLIVFSFITDTRIGRLFKQ